jgi:hypothetical protein
MAGKRRSNHEGTIFKDQRGLWIAEFITPEGKKKRKTSKKQSVVKEWLVTSLAQVRSGYYVEDSKMTPLPCYRQYSIIEWINPTSGKDIYR